MDAQALLILTDVDAVYSGFGTPQQERLAQISARQARTLLAQGDLGVGSMGPKVDAAASFAEATGFPAYIAQLTDGARALSQQAGTTVVPDHQSRVPAARWRKAPDPGRHAWRGAPFRLELRTALRLHVGDPTVDGVEAWRADWFATRRS